MSAKVGVISDTHNLMRPEVLEILKTCDYILHAGDVTEERILDQIRSMGTLYVVRGNCDGYWARKLLQHQRFRIEDLEFLLVHDRSMAGPQVREVDVVVFGHSHKYTQDMVDGKLWFNPGSCGWPRFGGESSMAIMEISGKAYTITKVQL